jgi:alkanesulfonate monooxygenase SsuD/methylene tetrahydromethanopterin reductase-like flavin-dependent oxidoreductase (luciferase family)
MVAIIGGEIRRFRPLVNLYRQAGQRAGNAPETLRVGVHALGFVANTSQEARDLFFPGRHSMFTKIGRERGWPLSTRRQFEMLTQPGGAYLVGDPETVAAKIIDTSEVLGGISRTTFQMSSAALEHDAMLRSIEFLGREVAAIVRKSTKAI